MEIINYTHAKNNLDNLLREELSLSSNISAAVAAGNFTEVTRLKGRSASLPSELFSARAAVLQAKLQELEAQQTADYKELQTAKEESKNIDAIVTAQIQVLEQERIKLNNKALAALSLPQMIEEKIRKRSDEISRIKRELDDLLNL